jgi:hypothetical protein
MQLALERKLLEEAREARRREREALVTEVGLRVCRYCW